MHASLLAWSQAPTCATKPGSAAITDHRCWAAEKRSRLPASTEQVIHFTNVIVQTQPPAAIAKVPPFRRASEERSTKIALSCGSSSRGVRDRLLIGPAREFCRDVLEELHREAADVVVVGAGSLSKSEGGGVGCDAGRWCRGASLRYTTPTRVARCHAQ